MADNKVELPGSERRPIGTRVGDVSNDEAIGISVILKPMTRMAAPQSGGAAISREEFAAKCGADSSVIEKFKAFARQHNLKVTKVAPERRTVQLDGSAFNMSNTFGVQLDRYEHD